MHHTLAQRVLEKRLQSHLKFYLILEWLKKKKLLRNLFQQINNNTGLGSYGLNEVLEMLKNNIADTIIITDDTELYRLEIKCKKMWKYHRRNC